MDEDASNALLNYTNEVEMSRMNLCQKMLKVMNAVPYIQKDATVQAGQGRTYKGVTHDAVTAKLRGPMIDNGIVLHVSQTTENCVDGQTRQGAPKVRYEAWYNVSLINAENPDDRLTYAIHAHAEDSGDKAPGKALSYAVKMALLKAFCLETGENDESRYQPDEVAYITDDQVTSLSVLVDEVGADLPKLLKWLKVSDLTEIPASRYQTAVDALERKRAKEGA